MDRRAVLRLLGLGAVGVSGCVGTNSDEEGTTRAGATTEGTTTERTTTSTEETATDGATTTDRTTTEATTAEITTEETTTKIGSCPDSILPDSQRHVHSDYGLRIVAEDPEGPAVAIVGEEWRSILRTNEMSDEDRKFVSDTDFEGYVVLVVQYTKSSGGHDLRVTNVTIDGETLRGDVCVVTDGATQDAPTANLFVRVSYSGSPPTRALVSIRRPHETITVTSE